MAQLIYLVPIPWTGMLFFIALPGKKKDGFREESICQGMRQYGNDRAL